MERRKTNTGVAGIDVSKRTLDAAVLGEARQIQVASDPQGHAQLIAWLGEHDVRRVGLEASGGYERAIAERLREAGLEVVIHQPAEVRAFARFKRIKAKNDRIDARLIALATAQVEAVRAANDPRLVELAERLTAYEQASDRVAQMKTCLEQVTLPDLRAGLQVQLAQAKAWKQHLAHDILARIRACPDLAARFDLLRSLPGFGPIVAAQQLIRMPELGRLEHGRASSLIGVAPFDRDTGESHGQRHITGGRGRPRRLLYIAALAAIRTDPGHRANANRLRAAGKPPKVAIVAVMRKLIEAANTVLARGTPWVNHTAPA